MTACELDPTHSLIRDWVNIRIPQRNKNKQKRQVKGRRANTFVRAPLNVGYKMSGATDAIPRMSGGGRSMSISHTERLGLLTSSSTSFNTIEFEINPAITTFPWLCAVASRFEKYKFRKLNFIFTPILPATSTGSVTLAFDFDANDTAPIDNINACSYHDYSAGSIWSPLTLRTDLRVGDRMPEKLTRIGAPASADYFNYDVGTLYACIEGIIGNVGYLNVEYTVDLFIHQTESIVGGEISNTVTELAYVNLYQWTDQYAPVKASPKVQLPGIFEGSGVNRKFVFTQPFEGEYFFETVGTGLTVPQIITNTTYKGYHQSTNNGLLTSIANMLIKALPGQYIYPKFQSQPTTCTSCVSGFYPSSYANGFA